ncbi:MAG: 5'-nucleotidase C-terminal domain-containing protein [Bacteroidota bacterium]|jgi:2',3'-cyclic-nucleotide 2'-phosphodiesterase (5'-nucleotidase family)
MRLLVILVLLLSAGCSSRILTVSSTSTEVRSTASSVDTLNALYVLIEPYRDSMNDQMGEVIANADQDFTVRRRPSGNLNNWVADAVLANQIRNKRLSEPVFCLLNNGGIRSAIPKGIVTIGDIYKVMPFDNEVVWVRLPLKALKDIHSYILEKGGEPIANALVTKDSLIMNGLLERHTHFLVITSDYLLNGGDNMTFFRQAVEKTPTGMLIRDVLIEEARSQGVLIADTTNRMRFQE